MQQLVNKEVYSWTTKIWANKMGLIDLIGTEKEPIGISLEEAKRLWNMKAIVDGVEVLLDVGKIYVSHHINDNTNDMNIRFGIWIKIPNSKEKYLTKVNNSVHFKRSESNKKRKRDSKEAPEFKIEHDLLESRSLHQLLEITKSDQYIQLGDLIFLNNS